MQEVADRIFLFRLQCKRDFEYVDGNGLRHFNKHMLILWTLKVIIVLRLIYYMKPVFGFGCIICL